MTSHSKKGNKLPNVNGFNQEKPRHSMGFRAQHRVAKAISCVLVAAVVFIATAIGISAYMLAHAPHLIQVIPQKTQKKIELIDPNAGKPITFLVLGQDTRDGANGAMSGGTEEDAGEHNADTTMVFQISADRSYINVVSIPRDSLVDAPSCNTSKGTIPARYNVMFNSIFADGWRSGGNLASAASCTVNAVNSLTGLDIQQFIVVDFSGLKSMIDSIGGVDVCIPVDTKDEYTDLDLKHGMNHLDGFTATTYARMRHGTGTDGSDIMRTTRQQYLVKQLIGDALSKNLVTNSVQLYRLAHSALKSLDISNELAKTSVLAGLAMSLKNIQQDHIYTRTIPVTAAPTDPNNRVIWAPEASDVWAKLRNFQPLTEEQTTGTDQSNQTGGGSTNQDQSQNDSSNQNQSTTTTESAPDPTTGLITRADGTLIDPATGGIVDPENGSIRDPNTGQYTGIATKYLNNTICKVPAQQ